jgi:hypothetical protein
VRGSWIPRLALALAVWLGLALPGGAQSDAEGERAGEVRGVTVSCQTWGWEWGSDAMVEALDELSGLGANWVAIHPYARIHADGSVTARGLDGQPPRWLSRPIQEAQQRGLKILIKPHLAYWGSPFAWRGEITFDEPAQWERFWRDYAAWILRIVEHCPQADAFVVGTELDKTLVHEARWRALIAQVRARTQAPLTYAANWTDYQRVGFWDALDVVGVQGYFPLVQHERVPSDAELRAGWAKVLERVSAFARARNKKVVFTELGYDRSPKAASRPWESGRGTPRAAADAARALQVRCMREALRACGAHPDVVGAFLWKWFPGSTRGEDFLVSAPPVREVVRRAWSR